MARWDDEERDDDLDISVPRGRRAEGQVPTYLTQAILVTLCCCWPLGIVAIVNAAKVNSKLAQGDYPGAVQASESAKKWCIVSAILGVIAVIVQIFFVIANGSRQRF